ncbi:MAG: Tetratricopeptide repeat [Candidatus Parcubacteria bacterium]|jgi:Flp pilus assembly protein TadD
MYYYAFFSAVILVSLVWLARIVVPKFPQLAIIDTSIIPEEREMKKKRELLRGKMHRTMTGASRAVGGFMAPKADAVRDLFRGSYRRLLDIERQFKREKRIPPAAARERLVALVAEGHALAKESRYPEAEKKFIEALGYDPRHIEAYRGLADLYLEEKRFDRAKETLAYLAKALIRENRCIHGSGIRTFQSEENAGACPASPAVHADIAGRWIALAAACQALGQDKGAKDAYERAVAVEPANPRNLDLLLEACIMGGDKRRADEVLLQLGTVNPENNKLEEFGGRLKAMAAVPEGRRRK